MLLASGVMSGQQGKDGAGVISPITGRDWGHIADNWKGPARMARTEHLYMYSVVGNIATIYSDRKTTRDCEAHEYNARQSFTSIEHVSRTIHAHVYE